MPDVPALVFLAICMAISAYGGRLFLAGLLSRSWPSTIATITTSRIVKALFSGTGQSRSKPVLELQYTYTVGGRTFTGKRITMAPNGWFSVGTPAGLHQKYPQGAEVSVVYNPRKPAMAALERGLPGRLWSFYAITGLFAVMALIELVNLIASLL